MLLLAPLQVGAPNHCITRRDERFVSEVCSNSDGSSFSSLSPPPPPVSSLTPAAHADSGQLLQYFALGANKAVSFLGRSQREGGAAGVFGTSIGATKQKKVAIVRGGKSTIQLSLKQGA
jgi:hypothetical protein